MKRSQKSKASTAREQSSHRSNDSASISISTSNINANINGSSSSGVRYTMDNTDSSPNVPMDEQESDDGSDNGNYYLRLESPNPNNIDDLDDNDSHLHSLSSYANAHQVTNNTASNCSSNHQRRSIGGNDDDDDDDDQLDAFFFNDNNTNNAPIDDRHGPRPVSATSIASSFIEKASSVLQETSSAVQEVIKHRTFCGSTVTNTLVPTNMQNSMIPHPLQQFHCVISNLLPLSNIY